MNPLALALLIALSGCTGKHLPLAAPAAPLTPPTRLCDAREVPPHCRRAAEIERLLSGDNTLVGMADPPSGSQGAKILTLRASLGGQKVVLRAKWRPQSSADLINEPRKELASYAVQKLFLKDTELVAPPTVARCFPLAEYRLFVPEERATFPGIDCVFGFASYWLEGVETVSAARKDGLLDEGAGILDANRFERDAVYRSSLAKANLLTYVIDHGDAHNEQFLIERGRHGLRAFVVDNSISFQSIHNPMLLFREDWSEIQVPWLPSNVLERMRALSADDYQKLGTIAVLAHEGARLRAVSTSAIAPASDGSAMSWQGEWLRVGLTHSEIELVKSRVQKLLSLPDLAKRSGPER